MPTSASRRDSAGRAGQHSPAGSWRFTRCTLRLAWTMRLVVAGRPPPNGGDRCQCGARTWA